MKRVLLVLLTDAANLSGYTFMHAAEMNSGAVYVCLAQLEAAGWVTSEFEEAPYPRRRFYRLTPDGWNSAHELLGLKRSEARRG
ncbi:PadR family transcriptional regulator [Microbispora sp. KK1-11]|nr:PadR family transcriptional regulator [Microbispora sp. KK1-11]